MEYVDRFLLRLAEVGEEFVAQASREKAHNECQLLAAYLRTKGVEVRVLADVPDTVCYLGNGVALCDPGEALLVPDVRGWDVYWAPNGIFACKGNEYRSVHEEGVHHGVRQERR